MAEKQLFSREEWLKSLGFSQDPFQSGAFQAETDPLFALPDISPYVGDESLIGNLIGDYYLPGPRFIFSKSGGGKSSIRKRIHRESEKIDLLGKKLLVVDYLNHNYLLEESSVQHHIDRIISLVEATINNHSVDFSKERSLNKKRSPKLALKSLINTCQKLGYKGLYILIDDLNLHIYEKILPLAISTDLNKIKGLVIKFFIPETLFLFAQQTLPFREFKPYILQWNEKELFEILSQRLSLCLESNLRTLVPGIPIFCDMNFSDTVQNFFIEIGKFGGPSIMWKFGNYLFDEHIKLAEQITDLIGETAFDKARLHLFGSILDMNQSIDYDLIENLQNKYKDIIARSANRRKKERIFLCCIAEDRDLVHDRLCRPLETEGYKVWMITEDVLPGERRDRAIEKAFEESDFFIPCFSAETFKRDDLFHRALHLAKQKKLNMPEDSVFIIPTLIEKCTVTDADLNALQSWDLNDEDSFLLLLTVLEKEGRKRRSQRKGKKI